MSEPTVNELFDLAGKNALITGASGWLGRAMATALAEAGAQVVVGSRDSTRGQETAAALPGGPHADVVIDQLNEKSIESGFQSAVEKTGKLDILINNGHAHGGADWSDVSAQEFDRVLSNATGWFLLSREFRNHVVNRSGQGSIVNIGSMYGQVASYPDAYEGIGPSSPVSYHAVKGGIIHMTRHLAVYWARDGIRVNCLSPGPFPSSAAPEGLAARLSEKSPLGRMGVPHELKGPLLLLASDAGSYITGQNLTVDGGWTAW